MPAAAHHVARFAFADLCQQARLGPSDYIAIATAFETVIVDDIPQMTEDTKDAARRFVTLIDALYEHRTALICSAAVTPDQLYVGQQGGFEFHRTVSRLIEMRAADYLGIAGISCKGPIGAWSSHCQRLPSDHSTTPAGVYR